MRILQLIRAREGVAAIEFAVSISLLLTMVLSGVEVTRYLLIEQKADQVASTMADLVTQNTALTISGMNQMMLAATQVMQPEASDFSTQGLVVITSVYQNGTGTTPTVLWNYSGGGSLSRTSQIGAVGGPATLPGGLTLNDKDNVIVAEVYYKYQPLLSPIPQDVMVSGDIYRVTTYKPRLGQLTQPPS